MTEILTIYIVFVIIAFILYIKKDTLTTANILSVAVVGTIMIHVLPAIIYIPPDPHVSANIGKYFVDSDIARQIVEIIRGIGFSLIYPISLYLLIYKLIKDDFLTKVSIKKHISIFFVGLSLTLIYQYLSLTDSEQLNYGQYRLSIFGSSIIVDPDHLFKILNTMMFIGIFISLTYVFLFINIFIKTTKNKTMDAFNEGNSSQ